MVGYTNKPSNQSQGRAVIHLGNGDTYETDSVRGLKILKQLEVERANAPKPQESKLKTILLGTPEQREARAEYFERDLTRKSDLPLLIKAITIPGYLFSLGLYRSLTQAEKEEGVARADLIKKGIEREAVKTFVMYGPVAYIAAHKLGEIFAQ